MVIAVRRQPKPRKASSTCSEVRRERRPWRRGLGVVMCVNSSVESVGAHRMRFNTLSPSRTAPQRVATVVSLEGFSLHKKRRHLTWSLPSTLSSFFTATRWRKHHTL